MNNLQKKIKSLSDNELQEIIDNRLKYSRELFMEAFNEQSERFMEKGIAESGIPQNSSPNTSKLPAALIWVLLLAYLTFLISSLASKINHQPYIPYAGMIAMLLFVALAIIIGIDNERHKLLKTPVLLIGLFILPPVMLVVYMIKRQVSVK